jgi:hypothetical protein
MHSLSSVGGCKSYSEISQLLERAVSASSHLKATRKIKARLLGHAPRKFTTRKSRKLHSVVKSEIHGLLGDEGGAHLWKKRKCRYRPWVNLNGRNLFGQELNNNAIGSQDWRRHFVPDNCNCFSICIDGECGLSHVRITCGSSQSSICWFWLIFCRCFHSLCKRNSIRDARAFRFFARDCY